MPRQEAPAQKGGLHPDVKHQLEQEEPSPDWSPFRQEWKTTPRKEAPAQAGGPSAQTEGSDPGGRLFSPVSGPCTLRLESLRPDRRPSPAGPQLTQAAHPRQGGIGPNGRPSAQTGDPQPRWESSIPDRRSPAQTEPRWEAAADMGASSAQTGGPSPKWEPASRTVHGSCILQRQNA